MKHKTLFAMLVILAVVGSSSGLVGCGGKEEPEATPPPAAQTTPAPAEQPTRPPAIPTPVPPTLTPLPPTPTAEPSGFAGLFARPEEVLDSYRLRSTVRLLEGGGLLEQEFDIEEEWVRQPPARRQATSFGDYAFETITIGNTTWVKAGDVWVRDDSGDVGSALAQDDLGPDVAEILRDLEGSMKPEGTDTVQGVRCQRYTVDADFSLPVPVDEDMPAEARQLLPQSVAGHIQGDLCIADQRGLPPVVVHFRTTQDITLKYSSRADQKMVYEQEHTLYDLNQPITIAPPENVMEVPVPPAEPSGGEPVPPAPAAQPGTAVEVASLDSLDSYRMNWSVHIQMGEGGAMVQTYTLERVRQPPAQRLLMGVEGGMLAAEYVWIGDTVWVKIGDTWMQAGEEDAKGAFADLDNILTPEDDMVLVGEETVNGIRCQRYLYDFGEMMHKELCVAAQDDLPPVVIQGLFRMKVGEMTTEVQGQVYDINQPITIEPPG